MIDYAKKHRQVRRRPMAVKLPGDREPRRCLDLRRTSFSVAAHYKAWWRRWLDAITHFLSDRHWRD